MVQFWSDNLDYSFILCTDHVWWPYVQSIIVELISIVIWTLNYEVMIMHWGIETRWRNTCCICWLFVVNTRGHCQNSGSEYDSYRKHGYMQFSSLLCWSVYIKSDFPFKGLCHISTVIHISRTGLKLHRWWRVELRESNFSRLCCWRFKSSHTAWPWRYHNSSKHW